MIARRDRLTGRYVPIYTEKDYYEVVDEKEQLKLAHKILIQDEYIKFFEQFNCKMYLLRHPTFESTHIIKDISNNEDSIEPKPKELVVVPECKLHSVKTYRFESIDRLGRLVRGKQVYVYPTGKDWFEVKQNIYYGTTLRMHIDEGLMGVSTEELITEFEV